MNDQIIQKLLDYLNRTEDFLLTQCPELFTEILQYHLYSSLIYMSLSLLGLIAGVVLIYMTIHYDWTKNVDFFQCVTGPVGFCIGFLCIIGIFDNLNTFMSIKVSPRYFLISKLTNMTKAAK